MDDTDVVVSVRDEVDDFGDVFAEEEAAPAWEPDKFTRKELLDARLFGVFYIFVMHLKLRKTYFLLYVLFVRNNPEGLFDLLVSVGLILAESLIFTFIYVILYWSDLHSPIRLTIRWELSKESRVMKYFIVGVLTLIAVVSTVRFVWFDLVSVPKLEETAPFQKYFGECDCGGTVSALSSFMTNYFAPFKALLSGFLVWFGIVRRRLNYDSPSSERIVRQMREGGKALPEINITLTTVLNDKPKTILEDFLLCLFFVDREDEVEHLSSLSSYSHYHWELLEELTTAELILLRRFFFSFDAEQHGQFGSCLYDNEKCCLVKNAIRGVKACIGLCKSQTEEEIAAEEEKKVQEEAMAQKRLDIVRQLQARMHEEEGHQVELSKMNKIEKRIAGKRRRLNRRLRRCVKRKDLIERMQNDGIGVAEAEEAEESAAARQVGALFQKTLRMGDSIRRMGSEALETGGTKKKKKKKGKKKKKKKKSKKKKKKGHHQGSDNEAEAEAEGEEEEDDSEDEEGGEIDDDDLDELSQHKIKKIEQARYAVYRAEMVQNPDSWAEEIADLERDIEHINERIAELDARAAAFLDEQSTRQRKPKIRRHRDMVADGVEEDENELGGEGEEDQPVIAEEDDDDDPPEGPVPETTIVEETTPVEEAEPKPWKQILGGLIQLALILLRQRLSYLLLVIMLLTKSLMHLGIVLAIFGFDYVLTFVIFAIRYWPDLRSRIRIVIRWELDRENRFFKAMWALLLSIMLFLGLSVLFMKPEDIFHLEDPYGQSIEKNLAAKMSQCNCTLDYNFNLQHVTAGDQFYLGYFVFFPGLKVLLAALHLYLKMMYKMINYNGPSAIRYYMQLRDEEEEPPTFPHVHWGMGDYWSKTNAIFQSILNVLFFAKSKEEVEAFSALPSLRHLAWDRLSGLSTKDIVDLRYFFFNVKEEQESMHDGGWLNDDFETWLHKNESCCLLRLAWSGCEWCCKCCAENEEEEEI